MMDQELIRKAAEAFWEVLRPKMVGDYSDFRDCTLAELPPTIIKWFDAGAEAALKVFLEHTRSQREKQESGVRSQEPE